MKKKEFEQLGAEKRYEALCVLAKVIMGLHEELAITKDKIIRELAMYTKLANCDVINAQRMKNIIDIKQQSKQSKMHTKEMTRLHATEFSIAEDIEKYENRMRDFLIIFFDLKSLEKNGFDFSTSLDTDTIHLYPYKGKSVADDAKHGHYGIVFSRKRVFRRAYGAYKHNGGERKKQGQNKKDVTEPFNLDTFLTLMTPKSAKSAK